jgi:DNA mismatch repair protein MSH5
MSKRKAADYLPNHLAALKIFRIRTIEMFTLSDTMFVNANTLTSLQIIQAETHPNSHMQGPNKSTSGAKESLSIYGLFCHLARTPQGKQKLRQTFLRPSIDIKVIRGRHNAISILLRPDNFPVVESICESMKHIKDMRTVIIHLQKGVCDIPGKASSINRGVWASTQKFSFNMLQVLDGIRELKNTQGIVVINKVSLLINYLDIIDAFSQCL